jgi:hypothetical protein
MSEYTYEQMLEVANSIYKQIMATATVHEVMSWGIQTLEAVKVNDSVALQFSVRGFNFQGTVQVCNGQDRYDVRFLNCGRVIKTLNGIPPSHLGKILDSEIETGQMTCDEYNAKVQSFLDYMELLGLTRDPLVENMEAIVDHFMQKHIG